MESEEHEKARKGRGREHQKARRVRRGRCFISINILLFTSLLFQDLCPASRGRLGSQDNVTFHRVSDMNLYLCSTD